MEPENPGTQRTLPVVTSLNAFFWTSGSDGRLRILRCDACEAWIHPPSSICPACLSRSLKPQVVSGLAIVETFTINHHPWSAGLVVPYIVAIVSLRECSEIRLTTNLIHIEPADVRIGDRVRVIFEKHHDVWLPLFTSV